MDDAERTIRRLRAGAREQQEDAEAVVAELAMATRTLREAVLDRARRGCAIRIELGSTVLLGTVVHVGSELVRLSSGDREMVDVVLDAVSAMRIEASEGNVAPVSTGYPETLLARCRELVQVNAEVEIGRSNAPVLRGRIMAVNATHLELLDGVGGSWLVPTGAVGWVRRVST
jgi:hypothetical protein